MVQLQGKGPPPAMQDKELYQHILGQTSPWTVSGVKWDIPAEEITVLSARKNSQSRSTPFLRTTLAHHA
jgi:hypothetical protein